MITKAVLKSQEENKMIESYAAIDRIENDLVILEIELYSTEKNQDIPFPRRDCYMADVQLKAFASLGEIHEGDVFVVKHDDNTVIPVRFAPEEKEARIEFLRKLIG